MEYNREKREIIFDKEINNLDRFVIDFVSLLDDYVIVSGYVSILFGRARSTEDVDLLVPKMNYADFEKLWNKIMKNGFGCLNTFEPKKAFEMLDKNAIRFSYNGRFIPNMEFKIMRTDIDRYSFENKVKVVLGDKVLFISPIEMQIAFKLFFSGEGSDEELRVDKDIEDARYIYKIFEDKINKDELFELSRKLNVSDRMRWL